MSAATTGGATSSWWYCGNCGFKNHPRQGQDGTKCEQCGDDRKNSQAKDYDPGVSNA